ncbi:MAG: chorismate synthase [Oscillospiraceae bacterium]|nr:chorismate synthase [Oscillospiraceae bacterium]
MASIYGNNIKISIFGQSHSEAIGVVMDGIPAGIKIDVQQLQAFLERRAPGRSALASQRMESDVPEFVSGLIDGVTCGAPLCAVMRNTDVRSEDYLKIRDVPRPGHADYTAFVKYNGNNDHRGGGHLSGRLTAPLCIAGGICLQILEQKGIEIGAHIAEIAGVSDEAFHPVNVCSDTLKAVKNKDFPTLCDETGNIMKAVILSAKNDGDSVGGIVACAVIGVPAGLGDPIFDGVENRIANIVFGIPAVRGIEFGNGFASTLLRGSANNDALYAEHGAVKMRSNNHGGILGGMTSGMPLLFRVAVKPTPSIAQAQESVRLRSDGGAGFTADRAEIKVSGRHDPCIVPRVVPCVEAAAAIAILDMMI